MRMIKNLPGALVALAVLLWTLAALPIFMFAAYRRGRATKPWPRQKPPTPAVPAADHSTTKPGLNAHDIELIP